MLKDRKVALIAGATGLVGQELLKLLLENSTYDKIIILVRKEIPIQHTKLEQVIVDYEKLDDYIQDYKIDDLFCCLGTTIKKAGTQEAFKKVDYEYPLNLARLANKMGVKKFLIITALGANSDSKIFYSKVKGEVEEELKNIGLPSLHIFQPSLLLGNREEFRIGERLSIILSPIFSWMMMGGLKKYKPIQAKDVANSMFKVAQYKETGSFTYPSDRIASISNS